jgi:hypothetical protein
MQILRQSLTTGHKLNLHMPNSNLASYQKGACHAGIKLFSTLPLNIKVQIMTQKYNLSKQ